MAKRVSKPRVRWDAVGRYLHIEAPGCIVNIYVGLRGNGNSADVTSISITADADRFSGEAPWWCTPGEFDQHGGAIRIVRRDSDKPKNK